MTREDKIKIQHKESTCANYKALFGQKIIINGIPFLNEKGDQVNACVNASEHKQGYNRCDLCVNFKNKE